MSATTNKLKIIAAVTMIIDHVACYFLPMGWLYMVMRLIGRISFPLFSFAIAVGWKKAETRKTISQGFLSPPLLLKLSVPFLQEQSMFLFTFCLAIGCIEFLKMAVRNKTPLLLSLLYLIPCCMFADFVHLDYGSYGILLVVSLWAIVNNKIRFPFSSNDASYNEKKNNNYFFSKKQILLIFLLFFTLNCFYSLQYAFSDIDLFFVLMQHASLLAFFPLALYNGKPGSKKMRWWFYIFYPAHFCIIFIVLSLI